MSCKQRIIFLENIDDNVASRMPAFNESMLYVIFFVAYLLVNLYLLMNLLLAVIFSNYKQQLQVRRTPTSVSNSQSFLVLGRTTVNRKTSR